MYYEKQKSYDKTELTFQPTLVAVRRSFVNILCEDDCYTCVFMFTVTAAVQLPGPAQRSDVPGSFLHWLRFGHGKHSVLSVNCSKLSKFVKWHNTLSQLFKVK